MYGIKTGIICDSGFCVLVYSDEKSVLEIFEKWLSVNPLRMHQALNPGKKQHIAQRNEQLLKLLFTALCICIY